MDQGIMSKMIRKTTLFFILMNLMFQKLNF